jgi:hypothetical protein
MRIAKGPIHGFTLFITWDELHDLLWVQSTDKSKLRLYRVQTLADVVDKHPAKPNPFNRYQYKWVLENVLTHIELNNLFPGCVVNEVRMEV